MCCSLKYQFDVINTMYFRAKYHPYRNKEMEEAMIIFKLWLNKYSKLKLYEDKTYPFLSDIYTKFLKIYKKVNGKPHKLQYITIKSTNYDYWSYRIYFINKILKKKFKLYTKQNIPTRLHLLLILYAYSPDSRIRF